MTDAMPNLVSNENEQQFLAQQEQRYEDLIKKICEVESCSRGKAVRIIKARSRKVIKEYNKSVAANKNKPRIDVTGEV